MSISFEQAVAELATGNYKTVDDIFDLVKQVSGHVSGATSLLGWAGVFLLAHWFSQDSAIPRGQTIKPFAHPTRLRSHRTRLAALPNVVRWVGSKALWILLLLPILTSCSFSACDRTTDLSPYGCDVCGDRLLFASCINKNFPIGSNLSNLESYLTKIGFVKHNRIEKEFYFRWSSNDLWNVVVVVRGKYKENTEITELVIHPLYIPKKRKH